MTAEPTLIIQMQRMGDLIMTFPLMAWLRVMEPEHPVWLVAEPTFADALMPFAPPAVIFSPEAAPRLAARPFHRVINLSHRQASLELAGSVSAHTRIGAFGQEDALRIQGAWRLYRASIVHNNRHNRFHWSDLNALDTVPARFLPRTVWPPVRAFRHEGRIGLFVGASETAKHPTAEFWAELANQLIRRGFNPVFLGGKSEKSLGARAAQLSGIPRSNLTGHFDLEKFAAFIERLDLLITPDTGPMHLGAWLGTPTLNLSMGPVNPWETAPAPPGHYILRPERTCSGCWQCLRPRLHNAPPCHAAFSPKRVSALIQTLLHGHARRVTLPGLRLLRTARDSRGLFMLETADQRPRRARDHLGDFWREAFLHMLDGPAPRLDAALDDLRRANPHLPALLPRSMGRIARRLAKGDPGDLWLSVPQFLRPFSGYAQMVWENLDRGPDARRAVLGLADKLLEAVGRH